MKKTSRSRPLKKITGQALFWWRLQIYEKPTVDYPYIIILEFVKY